MLNQLWHDLWIAVFVVLIFIGIFAEQGLVIGFGVMGLLFAGTAWLWNRLSLQELTYEREFSQNRVFIGEEFTMSITLTNRKPIPLGRVLIEDDIPDAIELIDAETVMSPLPEMSSLRLMTSMSWYERIRWNYRVRCTRRGFFRLGPVSLESGDLFGLFKSVDSIRGNDYVLVYPQVVPLEELGMPAARPFGESREGIRIFQDPSRPLSIRDYERGDPLKIINWKATARVGHLQSNTYEPSSNITVTLVVMVETSGKYWEGYSKVNLERVIVAAASMAQYAFDKNYTLGLFSNGTPILADRPMRIAPNRSPEQLTIILEALATIRPLAMGPLVPQLEEHARRFPLGSTLVIVTALVQDDFIEAIDSLRGYGYKIVIVYVGEGECPHFPDDVIVHELQDYFEQMELASEFGPRQDSYSGAAAK